MEVPSRIIRASYLENSPVQEKGESSNSDTPGSIQECLESKRTKEDSAITGRAVENTTYSIQWTMQLNLPEGDDKKLATALITGLEPDRIILRPDIVTMCVNAK